MFIVDTLRTVNNSKNTLSRKSNACKRVCAIFNPSGARFKSVWKSKGWCVFLAEGEWQKRVVDALGMQNSLESEIW